MQITPRQAHRFAAILALWLVAFAAPAAAEEPAPMTGAEFDAYATGRTLSYAAGGEIFGTEQYLPGRRVVWAFTDDICKEGTWYEQDGMICFAYDEPSTPQCWKFWREGDGLRALFEADPAGTELTEVQNSAEPLRCPGPALGV